MKFRILRTWSVLALSIISLLAHAQSEEVEEVDLSSPYKSIWTTLFYLQPENYNDSLAAQPFSPERRGMEKAKNAALSFKQVLDGNGIYLYMDEIPKTNNFYDSALNKQKYVVTNRFPDIYLIRRASSHDGYFPTQPYRR